MITEPKSLQVELSQVQRVRLKQWYRKNMVVKAPPPPTQEEVR